MSIFFSAIRQAIVDKINNDATKIKVAYKADQSEFSGFPAAVVAPSDNAAEFGSTARDKFTMTFNVRIYYPIKDKTKQEEADLALEKAVDEMIDIFKSRDAIGVACDWVRPIPSSWEYEERGSGIMRVAIVKIECVKHIANV